MPIDAHGICDGTRPALPAGPPYTPPTIIARNLNHKGLYAADVTPGGIALPLALHHVIPWEHLWTFWNALISQERYEAARDFLAILGVPKTDTANMGQKMKAGTYVGGADNFDETICWAPWNLVRGPEFRTKIPPGTPIDVNDERDPGPHVDDMHWMAGRNQERLTQLVDIDGLIVQYTNLPANQRPSEKDFRTTLRSWTELARQPLVEFTEDMWHIDTTSMPYAVSVAGAQATHPRWLKRKR